jgi:drug/metabolite transporter (DMT)-like permease
VSAAGTEARGKALATAGMVVTVLFWGTQLPLSQHVLQSIDQYYFGILRYGIGAVLFAATLWWREGARAFSLEGRGVSLVFHGCAGFTMFGLIVFWALYYTSPGHVSIIMALQPMLTAFWFWAVRGKRPEAHTLACILLAFAGLALVITRGDFSVAVSGGSLIGDAMAFAGAIGWIVYTLGAQRFAAWSPLRYTTLSCLAGTTGIVAIALLVTPLGIARVPDAATVLAQLPAIVYIGVFPFYVAIFLFAIAVARLGALNTLLIANATPVAVFAVDALRGHAPTPAEWAGSAVVIAALVASNLLDRRMAARAAPA